ncbi:hypothetical protein XdyCFBP7245_08325 [Xanthomonas dyei]|uniref:Uncharacterized protein n=1 Tax=Xanthomonas dyei TaxID=743699 RepID=A0A2S7C551_9XANT|nr:hypothetical protein XdyCFBP7245_08325 [Xanthomonas dyei]
MYLTRCSRKAIDQLRSDNTVCITFDRIERTLVETHVEQAGEHKDSLFVLDNIEHVFFKKRVGFSSSIGELETADPLPAISTGQQAAKRGHGILRLRRLCKHDGCTDRRQGDSQYPVENGFHPSLKMR